MKNFFKLSMLALFLLNLFSVQLFGGIRPDIEDFTATQRTQLRNLILQHAGANNNAVIIEHADGMANGASFHNYDEFFLSWHRDYIGDLENFLNNNGGSIFVPLPKWDPTNCIPNEFFFNAVVAGFGGLNNQCPSGYNFDRFLNPSTLCSNYAGTTPATFCGRTRTTPIDKFAADLECEHNRVHGSIGGVMGNFNSPAAAIFWLWHAWIDDIYWDYQTACQSACSLSASTNTINVSHNSTSSSFNVTSNGVWSVSSDQSWAGVSPASGIGNGTVTLSLAPNTSSQSRIATITITCCTETVQVCVIQAGVPECTSLNILSSASPLPSTGSSSSIFVSSNGSWNASTNTSWITLNTTSGNGSGSLSFSFSTNLSSFSRTGTITVSCGELTRTVTITQSGGNPPCSLSVSHTSFNVSAYITTTNNFNITSNGSWTISKPSWISLNQSSGFGNGTVYFTCSPTDYSRSGYIYVTCGGTTTSIRVRQMLLIPEFDGILRSEERPKKEVTKDFPLTVFPNPFSESTNIAFELKESTSVYLDIMDLTGRKVQTILTNENLDAGEHKYTFRPENLTPGIYYYRLNANGVIKSGKLVLQ